MEAERMTNSSRADLMAVPVAIHESWKQFAQAKSPPMRLEQAKDSSGADLLPLARAGSLPAMSLLSPAATWF
jgi:hypothetical protein